jgi:hypothetical protein
MIEGILERGAAAAHAVPVKPRKSRLSRTASSCKEQPAPKSILTDLDETFL